MEPHHGRREIDGCQDGSGAWIVVRGHGAARLELSDEGVNPGPHVVSSLLSRTWSGAMGRGRAHDGLPGRLTRGDHPCRRTLVQA